MVRKYFLINLIFFLTFLKGSSQEYFQQEVNFKIEVRLNDKRNELDAFEIVEYINNSPDTLSFLYFHLWPNAYSNNGTSLAKQIFSLKGKEKLFDDQELAGYIDSLSFKVKDQSLQWYYTPVGPDICKIILNEPLLPGDTIQITTPFHVKIPKGVTSLLGHIGDSYQISQWYPKPAVYDRTGWHQMPYLDQGEFYSEFGSYDVSITLPANYIVAATGSLQNEEEKKKLDLLAQDTIIMTSVEYSVTDFPTSSSQLKTLRFVQNKVHDFAWFADKRFLVRKGKVTLPDSGREITTWAMFPPHEIQLWKDAISYINNAIGYFSKWNGDYPYDSYTAVQSALSAGAGMEYPTLTVIGLAENGYLLDEVIAHEICHSWFYSALGSNERIFPFMDESITSAYESRYLIERYPGEKLWEVYYPNKKLATVLNILDIPVQKMMELDWLVQARSNLEQPANLSAPEYNQENYNIIIYNKAAQGFTYLRTFLGDSLFDSIMHDYYATWKFKHPQPTDLQMVFKVHTTKDVSWFFDDFITTTKRLDYKLVRYTDQKLLVKNNGELKAPFLLAEIRGDSIISEKWEAGFVGKKWINMPQNNYSEIIIDPEHKMPELYRLNNNIRTWGSNRKADQFQVRFLYTIEDPDKRSLIYIPAVDWTSENGFMAGVALHNGLFLPKPFEYFIIPFYTFRNPGFAGYGRASINITPFNNFIRIATFTIYGTQFGAPGNQDYRKVDIGINFSFRTAKMINPVSQKVFGNYIAASDLYQIEQLRPAGIRSYAQAGYQLEKNGLINPFNMLVSFESGKRYQKTSLEFNYKYSFRGHNSGLEMRFFTGTMLKNRPADPFYAFSSSGRGGSEQYFYEGIYPNRFDQFPRTFWSRQMDLSEGGLVTPVNNSLGYSKWVCSLSFTSNLPGVASKLPVKPFINFLLNNGGTGLTDNTMFFFEAGFKTGIWDFIEVYIPLIVSNNIDSIAGALKSRIRFVFKLDLFKSLRL